MTCIALRVIPHEDLHISTPNPISFGNPPNPPVQDPNWTNENWLCSRFHFNFADHHYDQAERERFGVLRVLNDDLVQPERGFATHGHRDMEIVTYVVHGQLTHEDSMGNVETLGRGSIQFMTAGTGVEHSEYNQHAELPFRCIQTWILPSAYDLKPSYGSYVTSNPSSDDCHSTKNRWRHVVANADNTSEDGSPKAPVQVHQDVNAYVAELEKDSEIEYTFAPNRQAYLVCLEGSVNLQTSDATKSLRKYDACEICATGAHEGTVKIRATEFEATENGDLAHVIMFEMALVPKVV